MAREGGIATRNRYGNEFFRQIRKKRRYYRKGYITRKTKERLRGSHSPRENRRSRLYFPWMLLAEAF